MERETGRAPVIEAAAICKHYGPIQALTGVDLALYPGEVVALVGDNGAGKSTLLKILCGASRPTAGGILIDGDEVHFDSPLDAREKGIEAVYQDLALAPHLPVWGNIFLGRERMSSGILGKAGHLDRRGMIAEAQETLTRTKIRIGSVEQLTGRLSGGQRQAVAVARAVTWGSRVVLMDEPTAALGVEQQAQVGELIRGVADHGTPVMLVSHNLNQVHQICDRILVLFQGTIVADLQPATSSVEEVVAYITGAHLRSGDHACN